MVQLIKTLYSRTHRSRVYKKLPFKSCAYDRFHSGTKHGSSSLQYGVSHSIAILLPAQLEHTYGMKWEKYLAQKKAPECFFYVLSRHAE